MTQQTNPPPVSLLGESLNFERIRRRTVQVLALISAIRVIAAGLPLLVISPEQATPVLTYVIIISSLHILWLVFAQFNQLRVAIYGLLTILLLEWFTVLSSEFPIAAGTYLTGAVLPILAAATLLERRWVVVVYNVVLVAIFARVSVTGFFAPELTPALFLEQTIDDISLLSVLFGITLTVRYFRNQILTAITQADQNANLLRISAEVGQVTAGITRLSELLPRAVNFIRDRFGYYHVQIFLVDKSGEVAELRASTGEVGQKLLERRHRLNVGSNSVIGRVTKTGQVVNYQDTGQEGIHYRNELLPNTRAELALPIRDGERIIGALDVQSTQPEAFASGQEQALQIMTNLLAASIRNVLLFEEQQQNIQENQRLYIEAQSNLREIQRLNRQLTKDSWERFVSDTEDGIGVTLEGDRISRDTRWTELLRRAGQSRQPIAEEQSSGYTVAVPIILRGEIIGAMEITPASEMDESDTVETIRAVSERLAVSLDNARLFEESQETTFFEQRINRIVGQYQNANSVDELLQITLTELSDTLGAEHGAIRLYTTGTSTDDVPNGAASSNGYNGASEHA